MESFSFENPLLRHYTVFDGLAGMHVEDIHQDQRGFIWIATADGGVSRFDGVHFDNLTESDGLPHPTVMGITESADGTLWFATLGGGVAKYKGHSFSVIGEKDGLPSNDVLGIRTETDGSVWAMTENGVARIGKDDRVEAWTQVGGEPIGFVYDSITDSTGRVWLATMSRGVVSLDGFSPQGAANESKEALFVWKFADDSNGGFWIACNYPGRNLTLYHYRPGDPRLEKICEGSKLRSRNVVSGVRHVRVDKENRVWIAHRGVVVFDGDHWHRFAPHNADLDRSDIRLTFFDREGNVWIGLWGGGLMFFDPASIHRVKGQAVLPDDEVTSLAEDSTERVWIGTRGGIARASIIGNVESRILVRSDEAEISCLASDAIGDVWVGWLSGEIYRWRDNNVDRVCVPIVEEGSAYNLYSDNHGRVWCGTADGAFGYVSEGEFHTVREGGVSGIYVTLKDKCGRTWVGCRGYSSALCYFDGEDFHIPQGEGVENIRYVNAMREIEDGTLWIGTANGLFAYDAGRESTRHFTMADGLSENAVTALSVDMENNLWIGTSGGGAVCYDGEAFKIVKLGNSAPENKVEAILCDSRGKMWFGTRDGLAVYNRGHIPPGIVIRQLSAGETVLEPERAVFSEAIQEVRIGFQGIGFRSGARQLCYSYRLDGPGESEGWSQFLTTNEVVLGRLQAGAYTFAVRAMDRDGLISQEARLPIEVTQDVQKERIYALEEVLRRGDHSLLCESEAMRASLENIGLVGATDFSVLILGETGTGKGLVARLLHEMSNRREMPFIPLNCGAIPEGLIESELFGHEKGAFTGAVDSKLGFFELAEGGTLFLDEIGDLPVASQRVLLHVLEQKTLTRVGGTRAVPLDVRFVAATNRNLDQETTAGTFRQDLLYPLDEYTVTLPPLRERVDDISPMISHFVDRTARHLSRNVPELGPGVVAYLQEYGWPGNVRELEHILQRAVLICRNDIIQISDLPALTPEREAGGESESVGQPEEETVDQGDGEKRRIMEALRASNGIVYGERGAALVLGIHPECLRARMRKYGIVSPRKRGKSKSAQDRVV